VDEIIIVDTGSTDKNRGDRQGAWGEGILLPLVADDFSAARNIFSPTPPETGSTGWTPTPCPQNAGSSIHDLVFLAEEKTAGYLIQVHIPPAPESSASPIVDHVKLFATLLTTVSRDASTNRSGADLIGTAERSSGQICMLCIPL